MKMNFLLWILPTCSMLKQTNVGDCVGIFTTNFVFHYLFSASFLPFLDSGCSK